jgi:hypothetical protein
MGTKIMAKQFEETINKWVEGILASLEQWIQSLHEELCSKIQRTMKLIEAMQLGLETELAELKARAGHGGCRNTATRVDRIKLPRFNGCMSCGGAQQLDRPGESHTPPGYPSGGGI